MTYLSKIISITTISVYDIAQSRKTFLSSGRNTFKCVTLMLVQSLPVRVSAQLDAAQVEVVVCFHNRCACSSGYQLRPRPCWRTQRKHGLCKYCIVVPACLLEPPRFVYSRRRSTLPPSLPRDLATRPII